MSQPRYRRRLLDMVVEASMIFLAVLLALASEEWRESRDRHELADRALHAVTGEIRSNLDELERAGPPNAARLEAAREALARLEEGQELDAADIGLEIALLSSAAWESARMSQAVQFIDLDIVRELSEVYEVQALYERMQLGMVDRIGDLVRVAEEDPTAAVREGVSSAGMLQEVRSSLAGVYSAALEELAPE